MKRTISIVLVTVLFACLFPIMAYADTSYEAAPSGDECYVIVTTQEYAARSSNTKSGSKTYTGYGSENTAVWKITLSGSFTYNGTTSTCTSSSCSVAIYDSSWRTVSRSSSKSGNTAYGTATLEHIVLGVVVSTSTHDLSLSCDKNGNLT